MKNPTVDIELSIVLDYLSWEYESWNAPVGECDH